MSIYYFEKYSHFYPFRDTDGLDYTMCTISVWEQVRMYCVRKSSMPRSFFDCGAAVGYLVREADMLGLRASGIDIRRYPPVPETEKYFTSGQIQIKSILDAAPVTADLAYCNGTLTYLNEVTLPIALKKFQNVGMLIAVHNTTEDVQAAFKTGEPIVHREPRLIRSNDWWMNIFRNNGFRVDFDSENKCFCARPIKDDAASKYQGFVSATRLGGGFIRAFSRGV